MPTLQLDIKYKKNTGAMISPDELLDLYFYGVTMESKDGTVFPKDTIEFCIQAAQNEIQEFLKIKLFQTFYEDSAAYYRDDYNRGFPIIKTRYPVNEALSLVGKFNKVEQITYPPEWLQCHKNSDGVAQKRISIVPSASTSVNTSQDFILTGLTTQLGLGSYGNVPDYWHFQYITGFNSDNVPMAIIQLLGMYAAIPLFALAGDLILGAGIASQSLSIDGLSQSISTTSSAENGGYSSRIIEYRKATKQIMENLKTVYRGYNWSVM